MGRGPGAAAWAASTTNPRTAPLKGVISAADIAAFAWPDPRDPGRFAGMAERARHIREVERRAVFVGSLCAGVTEMHFRLRGYEDGYMDLAADPALARQLMERITELKLAYWEQVLDEIGDVIDVAAEADDLGAQHAPLFSPRTYREIVKPLHAELVRYIKSRSRARFFLHSCGAIRDLIPDLIEIGVDCLNPVQVSAAGMDTAELKAEFGGDITFWGGAVDTQGVLARGTPDEVARGGAPAHRRPQAGRRLRLRQRPQHPGARARSRTSWPCGRRSRRPAAMPEPTLVASVSGRLVLGDAVRPGPCAGRGRPHRRHRGRPGGARPTSPSRPASSTSTSTAGAGTTPWAGRDALDGMARALARRGVTSFLPTSVTASFERLDGLRRRAFASWMPAAPARRRGAARLQHGGAVPRRVAQGRPPGRPAAPSGRPRRGRRWPTFLEGLRVITIAPELPGALELIARLAARGVRVSLGHSAATVAQARAGYAAGAVTTTHLFNAMGGVDPSRARAGRWRRCSTTPPGSSSSPTRLHVDPELWPLIWRLKPAERVLLVSDAIALAGSGRTHGWLGELEVRVDGDRVTLVEGGNLAGSVTALDLELRNLVRAGIPLPDAVRGRQHQPAELLGLTDRGRLEAGPARRPRGARRDARASAASCATGRGSSSRRPESGARAPVAGRRGPGAV